MIIQVKVNTSAKSPSIRFIQGVYEVKLKAVREKGKANEKIIETLASYFNISKSQVEILRGKSSTIKTIKIEE